LQSSRTAELAADTRALVELLANRDPQRFDGLYAALPAWMQEGVERLSPIAGASRLHVPVELWSRRSAT
jgi:hypothetical protein